MTYIIVDPTRIEARVLPGKNEAQNLGLLGAVGGLFTAGGSLLFYWACSSSFTLLADQILGLLIWLSYVTLILMFLGIVVAFLGVSQILEAKRRSAGQYVSAPSAVVTANVLGLRKYSSTMLACAVLYGIFYAAVSSIIVYRPTENFAEQYLAVIPSIVPTICCGGLGFIPVFTIYITEHLGLLIVPANIILLILVSSLVGLNAALALYTFEKRPKGASARWVAGFGAITGLFTSCPTCAGVFLGNLIQAAGTVTIAAILATYQPLFVAVTFPMLLASTFMISRRLRQALYGTCKVIRSGESIDFQP